MREELGRRSKTTAALCLVSVLAAGVPFVESGCSGDDSTGAVPSADGGADVAAQPSNDATVPSDTGAADGSVDDADSDAEPPFDCSPDAQGGDVLPNDLRCTGLYDSWSSKAIAAGVSEYKPAYVLWSDGADKRRWAYFPPGTQIDTTSMDVWVFPAGTKFWKEFSFNGVRVETRLFEKIGGSTWAWTTYVWTADQSSAVRNDDGVGGDAGGDAAYDGYEIPDHEKCQTCHEGSFENVLGFEAVLLGAPGATGLTLDALVKSNLLTVNPPSTTIAIPNDLTGNDQKALGWLHANCGVSCHNEVGSCSVRAHFKMKYSAIVLADGGVASVKSLDTYTTAVNQPAAFPAGTMRITPGDASTSAVSILTGQRNAVDPEQNQMPWLDSHKVDTVDHADVDSWITAIPP